MEIKIFENPQQLAKEVSNIICRKIKNNPSLVLGFASGETVKPLYRQLARLYKNKKTDFSKITAFNLDEYYGVDYKNSLRSFMDAHLFKKINIKESNINFLSYDNKKEKEYKEYERKIKKVGGIDLQILGIGINGHIGFNEPGSSFRSRTRKIKLSEKTRNYSKKYFGSLRYVPKYAITMGIGTIMESKKIILLATGKSKSNLLKL